MTPTQRKLLDAMKDAVARGWGTTPSEYGYVVRWETEPIDVSHEGAAFLARVNGGRTTTKGSVSVTMTLRGKPLVQVRHCGWTALSGGETTYKRAMAVLADPYVALTTPTASGAWDRSNERRGHGHV